MSHGSPAAMGSGSGTAEPAHGQHGDSSDAAASPSAVAADASSSSSPPPPLPTAAPLERPQDERDREQAGGSCSAAAAGVDRKGKGLETLDPAVLSSAPSPPSSAGSSSDSEDGAASGAGPFDCRLAFQQMLQEQTAIKEAGGPLAEGAGKKKKPEEAQVKSSHSIGALWGNLTKFFHGEEWHYSQHVNHQAHPITEVRKYYLVSDLATGQGVDHLDAYSEFRPVTGDGECFYRSFIFSYLEQVLDRQDTHEEHRLLDAVKRVSVQHADLRWTSEFPRSYRGMHNFLQ